MFSLVLQPSYRGGYLAVMSDEANNGGYFAMRNEVSKLQWELNVSKTRVYTTVEAG